MALAWGVITIFCIQNSRIELKKLFKAEKEKKIDQAELGSISGPTAQEVGTLLNEPVNQT
jgi:hypothetical protein